MKLLGKGNNPEFWSNEVRNKDCYKDYVSFHLNGWNKYCTGDGEFNSLLYSQYKVYGLTGERRGFQGPYYRRRLQLGFSAILSLIYPEEEKYLNFLMDKIFEVCNEYSWCIPAHQPNYLTVERRDMIDLFAAETGFTLAQIYSLLEDRLEPLIKDRIRVEIDKRIIESFGKSNEWGWERNSTNNWAAVCMGSVACTHMIMRPELFEKILPRIEATMERYLSGFGDDGFCKEGTHYWHYGFGFFMAYADMVRIFTEGKINYFARPKVKAIGSFIQKVYLSGPASVSFADCHRTVEYHIGMCHYLKREYPDAIKVYTPKLSYIDDGCGRFCWRLTAATWLDEDVYNNPEPEAGEAEYYGANAEWLIKKTKNYGFAAKGGCNKEPHNHNDVGSFIYAKNGRQVLCDVGIGVYSKQYFSSETRYGFIQCSSLGHSLPYFGDSIAQKFGGEYKATNAKYKDGVFSLNISDAYGNEDLKSLIRKFEFTDDSISLEDTFDYKGCDNVTERLTSLFEPKLIERGKITLEDGTVISFDEKVVESIDYETVPLSRGAEKQFYLIDLKLKASTDRFFAEVK